jgi:C1A family cysteine protease
MRSLIATAVAAVSTATIMNETDFAFVQYVAKYNKNYASMAEFNERLANFQAMDVEIKNLNSMGLSSVHGHNKFSDRSRAEMKAMNGYKSAPKDASVPVHQAANAPASVDWVAAGKVYAIQDQAQCGSCWAFSATCTVESSYAIGTNTSPLNLSEQQMVSCSKLNLGCNGGNFNYAWNYLKNSPQELNSDYPYTSGTGVSGKCTYNAALGKISTAATAFVAVSGDPASMQSAVAVKPNSVAIEADTAYFQSYTSGIMDSTACGTTLDHAVVIVGYGTSSTGVAYWTVRNSWGTSWGENGYFQVAQSTGLGICGINQDVAYPMTNN